MSSKSTPPPDWKGRLSTTTLAILRAVHDDLSEDWLAADKAYKHWLETGEGDEEILAENEYCASQTLHWLELVIDRVEDRSKG